MRISDWSSDVCSSDLFIQDVTYYDKRTLPLDPPEFEVLLTDKKRINVDAFARYQIVDPLTYFQRVRTEAGARDRLTDLINQALRRVLATSSLADVLSACRAGPRAGSQPPADQGGPDPGLNTITIWDGTPHPPRDTS